MNLRNQKMTRKKTRKMMFQVKMVKLAKMMTMRQVMVKRRTRVLFSMLSDPPCKTTPRWVSIGLILI